MVLNRRIDFVFPYVNANDAAWAEEYRRVIGKELSVERYRDPGTLEILIRLIEKNLPWVSVIHLVLADSTTAHAFLSQHRKVRVVRHSKFIPKDHLPTYNSSVIESYLHRIPGLSEFFIYGNDDVFPVKPLRPEDFFDFETGKVKLDITMVPFDIARRPFDDLRKSAATKLLRVDDVLYVPFQSHLLSPYRRSYYRRAYDEYSDVIEAAHTRVRDNSRNVNQYFFGYWLYLRNLTTPPMNLGCSQLAHKAAICLDEIFAQSRLVCLNDSGNIGGGEYRRVWRKIKMKLLSCLK